MKGIGRVPGVVLADMPEPGPVPGYCGACHETFNSVCEGCKGPMRPGEPIGCPTIDVGFVHCDTCGSYGRADMVGQACSWPRCTGTYRCNPKYRGHGHPRCVEI